MKHIGIQNGRKVAVLFRTVPNDSNNALVVYYEDLPEPIKTNFMECLNSQDGQGSTSLSDAAHRYSLGNGEKLLNALHIGNFIEKVSTRSVTLTPNEKTSLGLHELNNILDGAGGASAQPAAVAVDQKSSLPSGVLSDEELAADLRKQAEQLQAEAERLLEEAEELAPAPKRRGRPKKAETA